MLALVAAGLLAAAPPPIPAADAFRLPAVRECVREGALTMTLRGGWRWASATVTVDGRRVKTVTRAQRFRVRGLPLKPFELAVRARATDGRTATAKRRYHPCAPGGKPIVTIPEGAPPGKLVTRDLVVGTGVRVPRGSRRTLTVEYVGVAWSTRQEFDSSWDRDPFLFVWGIRQVIEGWERGLAGMRVGGRRELVIPPALAYGEEGAGGGIGPNETLVFVVDLLRSD